MPLPGGMMDGMGDARSMAWRVGGMYLVLALGGMAGALWLANRFSLGAAATAVSLLPTLAPLFLSWATFRASAQRAAEQTLEEVAEQLARAVHSQWEAEVRVRQLNDPYPLAVSWKAASEDVVETWPLLRAIAVDWPGGPASDPVGWAETPAALAGSGAQITPLFTRSVPTRRLLVLGPPGAGKTVLLLRLLLGLLAQRAPDGPDRGRQAVRAVPVLFPLASWNPARQDLYAWMAERLAADYSGLAQPAPDRYGPVDRARALLDHHLILPILDGFDEIPAAIRGTALGAINQALPLGQAVVLSSRVAEYRDALRPASGVPVKLAGAAGIELCPLSAADATAYLHRDAGGTGHAVDRWAALTTRLGTATPVGEALCTPLMLFLARTIYNPRPGEHTANLPHPGELCDTSRFPTRASVETQLFSAFIPAAYRPHPRYPCRWTPRQAHAALTFLARHLQRNLHGTPDLAWWQLHRAVPASAPQLITWPIGLLTGSALAITAAIQTAEDGIGARLGYALLAFVGGGIFPAFILTAPLWLAFEAEGRQPAAKIRWVRDWPWLAVSLSLAALIAMEGASAPVVVMFGLGVGIASGLRVGPADPALAVGPRSLWARDRRVFWQLTLATGATIGLGPEAALAGVTLSILPVGLGIGLWIGSSIAFSATAWGPFAVTRHYLALRRHLPRDLMSFLADAHEHRGVLRQAGAVYQFRHIDLQRHLAS
ncbi:NACHT domain-containing protein [Streptomyces sp. NPDC020719]|uniref:NACHT domain-containing protein n=1 Tax=Streptomyces sp. NPDC020719 TaxID=3154896 RepID=UPI0033DF0792